MFYEIINGKPVALGQQEEDSKIQTFATTSESVQDTDDIGSIMLFTSSKIPEGYLICNGQSLSKSEYSDLYSVIGGTFGETSTTFNLPDLREVVVAGVNTDYTLGTYKKDMFKSHTHLQCSHTHSTSAHTHSGNHIHLVCCDHQHCTNPMSYCIYSYGDCKCEYIGNNISQYYFSAYTPVSYTCAAYCTVNPTISSVSVTVSTAAVTYTNNTGSSDGITRGKRIGMYYIIKARIS